SDAYRRADRLRGGAYPRASGYRVFRAVVGKRRNPPVSSPDPAHPVSPSFRVGLISDTHGRLRPEVFDIFAGVDRIVHAGDVGDRDILIELAAIAPVTAVWGNVDYELR